MRIADTRFKREFSIFLDFSKEKSNLGLKTELELKLLITAQLSEVFIFKLPLFSGKLSFKNAFIEDWPQDLLDFKWLVECVDNFFISFVFSIFLRTNY